jgi:hypothetical protein
MSKGKNNMKKILFAIALVVALTGSMFSQTVYPMGGGLGVDVYTVQTWSAFAADSGAPAWSFAFPVADYDSVAVFSKATSVWGKANYRIVLEGLFANLTSRALSASADSLCNIIDTTNIKSGYLHYNSKVGTKGYPLARLKFVPYSYTTIGGTTYNRKDAIVTTYIVGYRRQYTGPR